MMPFNARACCVLQVLPLVAAAALQLDVDVCHNYHQNQLGRSFTTPGTRRIFAKQVLSSILSELEKSISNSNSSSTVEFDSGQPKGCHIFGKIKFVQFGGDYKVRMAGAAPNLKVKYVSYGASTQGN